jgi:redox-sensing transcriptional repressor
VEQKEISRAVISRLPRYYRYLGELREEGVERISSGDLSAKMRVTASQIRQDLNHYGGFGQQGYGYNVEFLHTEIGKILGLDRRHNVIIIGAGNLGQALANYSPFEKSGFVVRGIFDVDESLRGMVIRGVPVRMMSELEEFLKEQPIEIATLTIPAAQAVPVAEQLVSYGIKAIWNFAHTDLRLPEDVVVENVHLSDSMMRLSYNLSRYRRAHEKDV